MSKVEFEDSIGIIDEEILKRKAKWNLKILNWMDYEDVSQILRIHIFKKWHLYEPSKSLQPWLNRIISNQVLNVPLPRTMIPVVSAGSRTQPAHYTPTGSRTRSGHMNLSSPFPLIYILTK